MRHEVSVDEGDFVAQRRVSSDALCLNVMREGSAAYAAGIRF